MGIKRGFEFTKKDIAITSIQGNIKINNIPRQIQHKRIIRLATKLLGVRKLEKLDIHINKEIEYLEFNLPYTFDEPIVYIKNLNWEDVKEFAYE